MNCFICHGFTPNRLIAERDDIITGNKCIKLPTNSHIFLLSVFLLFIYNMYVYLRTGFYLGFILPFFH